MNLPVPTSSRLNAKRTLIAASALCLAAGLTITSAVAQHRGQPEKVVRHGKPDVAWKAPSKRRVVAKPTVIASPRGVVPPRRRRLGPILIYRPHGPRIYGYGFRYTDAEAVRWLAFTAITIKILDMLGEDQIRYHEQAQIEATGAPIGEAIVWESGAASGSVMPLREGTDARGHTCREFQQVVTIGGRQETAFGTACLKADGSWSMVE